MHSKKRILIAILIFFLVFLSGVVGFKYFGGDDWSLLDSLYMTVITISTVGFEEVLDLNANPGARIFTIVFILGCLGTIAYVISSVTAFIVEGELKNILWRRKMDKEISKLKDHFIVCGSDETAETIIKELILIRKKFVVIEPLKEQIEKLALLGNLLSIHGDPTEDSVLISAGIKKARGIVLSLSTDQENLFVTLTARSLNPKIRIVTKGIDEKSQQKMIKAGADAVVFPNNIGGMRMVSELIRPAVVSFLDMMLRDREKVLRFEEISVGENSSYLGKSIEECNIGEKTGALLVALKNRKGPGYLFNPSPDTVLNKGDILVLIASPDMVEELEKKAG